MRKGDEPSVAISSALSVEDSAPGSARSDSRHSTTLSVKNASAKSLRLEPCMKASRLAGSSYTPEGRYPQSARTLKSISRSTPPFETPEAAVRCGTSVSGPHQAVMDARQTGPVTESPLHHATLASLPGRSNDAIEPEQPEEREKESNPRSAAYGFG
eukprot:scaffold231437_cov30-Tisochrysis_lutea.AAC.1